jgi:hypothetical protein
MGAWLVRVVHGNAPSHPQRSSSERRISRGPCHFTQGMSSAVMRVRLVGDGSCVPVPVADTVVTGAAAVVVGDADVRLR